MRDRIEAFVENEKDQMIRDLVELIGYPSINGDAEENRKCLSAYLHMAEKLGFKTAKTSAGDAGIVEYGEGSETVGILVHLDVVAVGDAQKWEHDPFGGFVRDGWVHGRGAADDKNGAIMALYALKALKELVPDPEKRIRIIAGTGEEGEWTDMDHFKQEFQCPDCGFTPDGEFPLYNREKGYADAVLKFSQTGTKDFTIESIHTENSANTIPSLATVTLKASEEGAAVIRRLRHPKLLLKREENGCLTLTFTGVSAHSSIPEKGDNALCTLCSVLRPYIDICLFAFVDEFLSGDIHAKKLEIGCEDEYYNGVRIGRTTAVPTIITLEDGCLRLGINIRQQFGITKGDIEEAFIKYSSKYGYELSVKNLLDPIMIDQDLKIMKMMADAYEAWGFKNSFGLASGTTYAKAMPNIVAWGPLFPEDIDTCHEENERISVDSFLMAEKIYITFLCEAAATKESLL